MLEDDSGHKRKERKADPDELEEVIEEDMDTRDSGQAVEEEIRASIPWYKFNPRSLLDIFEKRAKNSCKEIMKEKQTRNELDKEEGLYYIILYNTVKQIKKKQNFSVINVENKLPEWDQDISDLPNSGQYYFLPVQTEPTIRVPTQERGGLGDQPLSANVAQKI